MKKVEYLKPRQRTLLSLFKRAAKEGRLSEVREEIDRRLKRITALRVSDPDIERVCQATYWNSFSLTREERAALLLRGIEKEKSGVSISQANLFAALSNIPN